MFDYVVYLFYRAGTDLLILLPLPLIFAIGQIGGAIGWLALPHYRKLALRNVRIAFGDELSEKQMRGIVRRHFQRLGANLLCSVKFTRMPVEKILERVRLENFEYAENCGPRIGELAGERHRYVPKRLPLFNLCKRYRKSP